MDRSKIRNQKTVSVVNKSTEKSLGRQILEMSLKFISYSFNHLKKKQWMLLHGILKCWNSWKHHTKFSIEWLRILKNSNDSKVYEPHSENGDPGISDASLVLGPLLCFITSFREIDVSKAD